MLLLEAVEDEKKPSSSSSSSNTLSTSSTSSTISKKEIQKRTRQFAKRQLTWFRREAKIEWYQPVEQHRILADIKVYLEN